MKGRIAELHDQFLKNPGKPTDAKRALDVYSKTRREIDKASQKINELQLEMQARSEKRRVLEMKFAQAKANYLAAVEALDNGKLHRASMALSRARTDLTKALDTSAEAILLTHGCVPITIGGVEHDFGESFGRVYLRARSGPKRKG